MFLTSLQCQLRNMKCSEEDDLRQYLDKAQDLFACLNDIGAKMENSEFLDIILGALLPSDESVMNALTTSLEEVGKPIEIDSIIRILKSQYDKKKSLSTTQEEQGFIETSLKKVLKCTNCRRKGHLIDTCLKIGIKLRYLHRNKLPRNIFILMHECDYVISCIITQEFGAD